MKKVGYKIISDNRTLLMGISILSIVFFHFVDSRYGAHYNYSGIYKYYGKYISSAGVDVFMMLSSFGLYYSFKKNSDLKKFFYRRFTRILVPALLVIIPTYAWISIRNHSSFWTFLGSITFFNTFINGDILFWFIPFICLCYLIFPILFNYIDSSKNKDEVFTRVLSLCLGLTLFCFLLYSSSPKLFDQYQIMILRLLPFYVGLYLGYRSYHNEKFEYSDYFLMFFGLLFIRFNDNSIIILRRYSLFFWFTSFLLICLIFLVKYFDKYKIIQFFRKIIEWFGKHSLEIYLLHIAFRDRLSSLGIPVYRIRYFLMYFLLTIICVPILNFLTNKIQGLLDKKLKV